MLLIVQNIFYAQRNNRFVYNKLVVGLVMLLLYCFHGNAQQRPYYTQYILNQYLINPAFAGIENYWDARASYRTQWVGLQDAPVTTYITINGPLSKSDYDRQTATTFHAPGENPLGDALWQNYSVPESHAGVGFTAINDITGPLNRFAAYGSYAYHIGIAPKTSLSVGISIGFTQLSLNADKLSFATPVDPAVGTSGIINSIKPDMSAGVLLYSDKYFIGLSMQQIIPEQVAFSNNTVALQSGKLLPHTFFTAGYKIPLSDDVSFLPSVMVRYINPLPISFDINSKFQYQDILWAGFSYRYQNGFAAMLGIHAAKDILIGYSYDLSTSLLNTVSKGTHELLIGFMINNRYGNTNPKLFW